MHSLAVSPDDEGESYSGVELRTANLPAENGQNPQTDQKQTSFSSNEQHRKHTSCKHFK